MSLNIKNNKKVINGKIYLKDLTPITKSQFENAINITKIIKNIIKSRQNKDLPAAGWIMNKESPPYQCYEFVVEPKYEIINRLRFYSPYFTGYELMTFSETFGKKFNKDYIENYDDFLGNEILQKPDISINKFINMIQFVPDWLIARPPKILGEIGWNINNSPVNRDIYDCQERLNILYETGIINWLKDINQKNEIKILEIGGGMAH